MTSRYRSDGTKLADFSDETLVVCPACGRRATVRLHKLEEARQQGTLRADYEAKLSCGACGHSAARPAFVRWVNAPVDSVFHCPVWLQLQCGPHTLWAYNARHLDALEQYVR